MPLKISEVALKLPKLLRCSHLVGEALYGFTPITIPQGIGDGQVLWYTLLSTTNRKYLSLSNRLLLITSTSILSSLIAGIDKTFPQARQKDNISSDSEYKKS